MSVLEALIGEASGLREATRDLRNLAQAAYARALKRIVPNAKRLSWSSGTRYDDSGYYSAIEDVTLLLADGTEIDLGTLSECDEFPTYWDELSDFDPQETDEFAGDMQPATRYAEDDPRFAAYLVSTYGFAPDVDWKELGEVVASMITLSEHDHTRIDLASSPRIDGPHAATVRAVAESVAPDFAATSIPVAA